MAPPIVNAVLLLFDDPIHTFSDVTEALESLGIPPATALLITTQVNSVGVNVVSKGSVEQMQHAALSLHAFNSSVVRLSDVDAAVTAASRRVKANTKLGLELDAIKQKVHRVVKVDELLQCPAWALAGACSRKPLVMYTRCEASCLSLGSNYLMAAMPREQQPLVTLAVQSSSLLGVVLFLSALMTSASFLFDTKRGASRRALGVRLATLLIALHFFIDGWSGLAAAASGNGFVLDDGDGVQIEEPSAQEQLLVAAAAATNSSVPTTEDVGLIWGAITAACVELTNGIGAMPWIARAPFDAAQLVASLVALSGRGGTPRVMWSGYVLLASAVLGALHVLLSVVVMQVMGGGMHLSELNAKKLALAPATFLMVLHSADHGDTRGGGAGGGELPLPSISPPKLRARARATTHAADERFGWVSGGLLLGRLLIAVLLATVCGAELWRLLFTPLRSQGAAPAGELVQQALRAELDPAVYRHRIEHEHGEALVRLPQLVLAFPLALGAATAQVAASLSLLSMGEAFCVWQWWHADVLANSLRLAHALEHFTVNLAIGGGLMLLPLRGSGTFTLDQLVKKLD